MKRRDITWEEIGKPFVPDTSEYFLFTKEELECLSCANAKAPTERRKRGGRS